jgi:diaminopimelate epimerase
VAPLTPASPLPFAKLSGSGNDFLLLDGRRGELDGFDLPELARRACARHTGVGADGLIVIQGSGVADFGWQFFNSDGSRAEMCGNGGRCAARYAFLQGIAPASMRFETAAGIIAARVEGARVTIQLTPPRDFREGLLLEVEGMEYQASFVNTGVPHTVLLFNDAGLVDVASHGRFIRFHPAFAPAGTNVNFVSVAGEGEIRVRTYERGVEGETLACGTGAVASAYVAWRRGLVAPPVRAVTSGGEVLTVHLRETGDGGPPEVLLEGATTLICRGEITPETFT